MGVKWKEFKDWLEKDNPNLFSIIFVFFWRWMLISFSIVLIFSLLAAFFRGL